MTFEEIVDIRCEKAMAEGRAEGRAAGREEGRAEGRQELFNKLLNEGLITMEYAVQNGYKQDNN